MTKAEGNARYVWSRILELWEGSVIVQSIITLGAVFTLFACFLVPLFRNGNLENITVPSELMLVIGTVLGYWFKTKSEYQAKKAAEVQWELNHNDHNSRQC
jgi:flagellar motor component MotA